MGRAGPSEPIRATLWVIVAAATLTVMAGAILGPIVPRIATSLGVSGTSAGLIVTTHGLFIVLLSPVAGSIIDRIGPRRPFLAGLVLYGIGGGAGLVLDSFLPLLASRAVLGIGVAFVYTSVTILIYDLYAGQAMDRALGLRSSANSAGAAVWPLVGGALGSVSWHLPFGIYLLALPLGLVALFTIPDSARGGRAQADGGGTETDGRGIVGVFRARPALPLVYVLYFGANTLLYAIVVFYPALLEGVGVTSPFVVSLYLAANGAAGAVSAVAYDRLKRRFGAHLLVVAAFVMWAVGLGATTVVETAPGAVPTVVLFGLGLGLVFPSAFAWVESLAPDDRQGQFSSYVASAGYLGQFVAPVLFGPLVPLLGVASVFAVGGAVAGIGALALGGALLRGSGVT